MEYPTVKIRMSVVVEVEVDGKVPPKEFIKSECIGAIYSEFPGVIAEKEDYVLFTKTVEVK